MHMVILLFTTLQRKKWRPRAASQHQLELSPLCLPMAMDLYSVGVEELSSTVSTLTVQSQWMRDSKNVFMVLEDSVFTPCRET